MVKIIKRLLQESKNAWDSKLKYALWVDKISTKSYSYKEHYEMLASVFQLTDTRV